MFHIFLQDEEGGLTLAIVVSVTFACLGNSFLYGYQIGVVNQPADVRLMLSLVSVVRVNM
jgi:hypothetical protein